MDSHFSVLNPEPGSGKNRQAVTGSLLNNPVHQAMTEACALAAPDFILNTVLAPDKRIVAAFAGHWCAAHEEGCRYYREHFSHRLQVKADLVIVSCGGFPKDINLIQAHKSMEYAAQALKDGGVMILLAECRDGFGNSNFFSWFRHSNLKDFETALREHYEINGQTAYSLFEKTRRFTIILVSEFSAAQTEQMGMIPAVSLDEGLRLAQEQLPDGWTTMVLPDGGCILPVPD
jgi:nickel-dependent lactate racemase